MIEWNTNLQKASISSELIGNLRVFDVTTITSLEKSVIWSHLNVFFLAAIIIVGNNHIEINNNHVLIGYLNFIIINKYWGKNFLHEANSLKIFKKHHFSVALQSYLYMFRDDNHLHFSKKKVLTDSNPRNFPYFHQIHFLINPLYYTGYIECNHH